MKREFERSDLCAEIIIIIIITGCFTSGVENGSNLISGGYLIRRVHEIQPEY